MFRRHPVLSTLTVVYLGLVAMITLGPRPFDGRTESLVYRIVDVLARWETTAWITYERLEFGANVAMFVPIGVFFLLLLGRRRWWLAVLIAATLTVAIETAQLTIPGRVSDPRDLLANASGAVAGVVVGLVLTTGSGRRARASARRRPALQH
ncbi:VanZ family protein [Plantibacter sp. ME-Dv--P-095]|uniref:VanZ family protein n=1 Tax=Plantibacter sp. ME-Dv--P-095 TaxID=3040299 RepID=UPI00254B68D8|nr:VanZ family protein [Plantibacter sp. ME-Dv--P-095]